MKGKVIGESNDERTKTPDSTGCGNGIVSISGRLCTRLNTYPTDSSFFRAHTSPYAYNDAPRLTLDTDPLASSPSGATAAYVEPDDTVAFTLTLESVGPQAITSTLTLCWPNFLTNVSGGDLTGDPPPAASRPSR